MQTHFDSPSACICEHCGKQFRNKHHIKKHLYVHNADLMPFECEICKKKFPQKRDIDDHMLRHQGIKNFVCPTCGLRKTTAHELKAHMNFHTREKTWPCDKCGFVFSCSATRSRHIRNVHLQIKKFRCPHCDSSFAKGETLKHHIMQHTGEKPHGCEVCGKRFIQMYHYKVHMKTHHGKDKFLHKKTIITAKGDEGD